MATTVYGENNLDWRIAKHTSAVFDGGAGDAHGNDGGALDPYTLFTVTGDVVIQAFWGVCNTSLTGTSATVSVGVLGNLGAMINPKTATDVDDGSIISTSTNTFGAGAVSSSNLIAVNDGADIIETTGIANITAGQIDYYCIWAPAESGASLVSA